MKYTVVAYKDLQLDSFYPPMFVLQDVDSIVESVKHACIKGKIEDAASKELFLLGLYDTETAIFELSKPASLLKLESLVKKDV